MLCRRLVGFVAVALIALAPALAGGSGHKKCTMSTQDCLDHMASKMKTTGFVGVELEMDDPSGVVKVIRTIPGTPAEAAGIQAGDVLFALNGVEINEKNEKALEKARKDWKPGQSVTYTIKRDGEDRQVTLTLAPMPADVLAKYIGEHMLEHASSEVASK
jgi:C-terminal processing protease CtpA/Prc